VAADAKPAKACANGTGRADVVSVVMALFSFVRRPEVTASGLKTPPLGRTGFLSQKSIDK
jgi:hypothetical protein